MVLLDLGTALAPDWAPLAVALVLMVALVLLWFSMRKHLRRADYPDLPSDADAGVRRSPRSPDL